MAVDRLARALGTKLSEILVEVEGSTGDGVRVCLCRLEERFECVGRAPRSRRPRGGGGTAESARAKLRGEGVEEEQRARDRDTLGRWQQATGVDLESEAQRVR